VTGLLLCDDLIFASKVTATARAAGGRVTVVKRADDIVPAYHREPTAGVLLDLHAAGLDIVAALAAVRAAGSPTVVAFGSHVDADRLRAARAAGCDLVLPRSAFVQRLEAELAGWLTGKSGHE
jgi:DNA-binding NarL/FixJ family response regulator